MLSTWWAKWGPVPHLHPLGNLLSRAPLLAIEDSRSLGLRSWQVTMRLSSALERCPSTWPFSKLANLLSFDLFIFFWLPSHHQLLELWDSVWWLSCLLRLAPMPHFPILTSHSEQRKRLLCHRDIFNGNYEQQGSCVSSSLHPSEGHLYVYKECHPLLELKMG